MDKQQGKMPDNEQHVFLERTRTLSESAAVTAANIVLVDSRMRHNP